MGSGGYSLTRTDTSSHSLNRDKTGHSDGSATLTAYSENDSYWHETIMISWGSYVSSCGSGSHYTYDRDVRAGSSVSVLNGSSIDQTWTDYTYHHHNYTYTSVVDGVVYADHDTDTWSDTWTWTDSFPAGDQWWSEAGVWNEVAGQVSELEGWATGALAEIAETLSGIGEWFADTYDDVVQGLTESLVHLHLPVDPQYEGSGYLFFSDSFVQWFGEGVARPLVGDARLAQQGGTLDDLLVTTLIVTEATGYVDPTPVSDLVNAGANAIDGNYGAATFSLGAAMLPGALDKGGAALKKGFGKMADSFSAAGKGLADTAGDTGATALGKTAKRTNAVKCGCGEVPPGCFVPTVVVAGLAPRVPTVDGQPEPELPGTAASEAFIGFHPEWAVAGLVSTASLRYLKHRRRKARQRVRDTDAFFALDGIAALWTGGPAQ